MRLSALKNRLTEYKAARTWTEWLLGYPNTIKVLDLFIRDREHNLSATEANPELDLTDYLRFAKTAPYAVNIDYAYLSGGRRDAALFRELNNNSAIVPVDMDEIRNLIRDRLTEDLNPEELALAAPSRFEVSQAPVALGWAVFTHETLDNSIANLATQDLRLFRLPPASSEPSSTVVLQLCDSEATSSPRHG